MRSLRHLPVALGAAGLAVFAASPALAGTQQVMADDPLHVYSADVPSTATARVHAVYDSAGSTHVTLHVKGLKPNTEYGAHAHVNACGATGAAAGPHFQNVPDPVTPSVDPMYANPTNEIWLDLTTNAAGNGVAHATVPWQFAPDRRAKSVILHVEHTHTGQTDSGIAGARLACLDVDF